METTLRPYHGRFIHGVNIGDWYPCWNLALAGQLWSPDFAALTDPGLAAAHQPLRDVPIHLLRTSGAPQGVPTPRATWYVWATASVRRGGHVGIGTEDTKWLPRADLDKILHIGDIELAFEEGRRRVVPEGASRLASLYLADDSDVGRAHVRAMLGVDILILRVTIPLALRVSRVDTKWFDLYCHNPKPEYIDNYWRSVALDPAAPTWEYLVDGMIEVDDPEGLAHIREFGAHRFFSQRNT
jgi:hypothetical protein